MEGKCCVRGINIFVTITATMTIPKFFHVVTFTCGGHLGIQTGGVILVVGVAYGGSFVLFTRLVDEFLEHGTRDEYVAFVCGLFSFFRFGLTFVFVLGCFLWGEPIRAVFCIGGERPACTPGFVVYLATVWTGFTPLLLFGRSTLICVPFPFAIFVATTILFFVIVTIIVIVVVAIMILSIGFFSV